MQHVFFVVVGIRLWNLLEEVKAVLIWFNFYGHLMGI